MFIFLLIISSDIIFCIKLTRIKNVIHLIKINTFQNMLIRFDSFNGVKFPISACARHCTFPGVFWESDRQTPWTVLLQP